MTESEFPFSRLLRIKIEEVELEEKFCLRINFIDGAKIEIFRGRDQIESCVLYMPGLFVASKNPQVAYDDVSKSIELLLKLNDGVRCRVSPELPFAEFMERITKKTKASIKSAPTLKSQRYSIAIVA